MSSSCELVEKRLALLYLSAAAVVLFVKLRGKEEEKQRGERCCRRRRWAPTLLAFVPFLARLLLRGEKAILLIHILSLETRSRYPSNAPRSRSQIPFQLPLLLPHTFIVDYANQLQVQLLRVQLDHLSTVPPHPVLPALGSERSLRGGAGIALKEGVSAAGAKRVKDSLNASSAS